MLPTILDLIEALVLLIAVAIAVGGIVKEAELLPRIVSASVRFVGETGAFAAFVISFGRCDWGSGDWRSLCVGLVVVLSLMLGMGWVVWKVLSGIFPLSNSPALLQGHA